VGAGRLKRRAGPHRFLIIDDMVRFGQEEEHRGRNAV